VPCGKGRSHDREAAVKFMKVLLSPKRDLCILELSRQMIERYFVLQMQCFL